MGLEEHSKSWKWLMEQIKIVQDPTLRKFMMAEFRKRAINDWGFDPVTTKISTNKPELDNWEKELLQDIEDAKMFKTDTRIKKREQTAKEAKARMMMFVERGGKLSDIPDNIRCETIDRLYHNCLTEYGDNLIQQVKDLL